MLIASALGLGLLPGAPGTFAALLGVALHVATCSLLPSALHVPLLVVCFAAVCVANHLLTPWAQAYWHHKDPKHFVLDEIAGYLLVPILFHKGELWQIALWGLLSFRILDVIKIPPARQIDRRGTGAWSILLDDVVSALYAVCVLYVLAWIGPQLGIERWLISDTH
jgi:phosphatidylglycerophosphatase A